MAPPDPTSGIDTKFLRFHTRATGITAAVSLGVMLFAVYVLPHPADVFVGALALIGVVACGAQFVFQGATLISLALRGQRRAQFQVSISLAAPIVIALLLASRVDAVPLETLWSILTPWTEPIPSAIVYGPHFAMAPVTGCLSVTDEVQPVTSNESEPSRRSRRIIADPHQIGRMGRW